jgi:hypothetical protein
VKAQQRAQLGVSADRRRSALARAASPERERNLWSSTTSRAFSCFFICSPFFQVQELLLESSAPERLNVEQIIVTIVRLIEVSERLPWLGSIQIYKAENNDPSVVLDSSFRPHLFFGH